ncbi:class I SAM-dependent methyltransferase [Calditrichota bacterium]
MNPHPVSDSDTDHHDHTDYDPFLSLQKRKSMLTFLYQTARKIMLSRKTSLVRRLTPLNSRVLDIGCGTGEFLARLAHDYQVVGLETEPKAAEYARVKHGIEVISGMLEESALQPKQFSLITMWHVLEHVPDPQNVMKIISDLLEDGGHLILGLPNIGSLDAYLYRKYWVAIDAPRHRWHFRKRQVYMLADDAGFEIVRIGMLPFDLFYNILLSEKSLIQTKSSTERLLSPIRMALTIPVSFLIGSLTNNYSSMFYVLRKS